MSLYSIETYGELRPHLDHEWILTNGIGGFTSSSVVGCNVRRYNALLCSAIKPPVGRYVALNRIGEIFAHGDEPAIEISCNQFDKSFHPRGDRHLRHFDLGHTARWQFDAGTTRVVKEVMLLWQKNTVAIRYTITPAKDKPVDVQLLPFVAMRDFHQVRHGTDAAFDLKFERQWFSLAESEATLQMSADHATWTAQPDWWKGHVYELERERGLDYVEDLFNPGRFTLRCRSATTVTLLATTDSLEKNFDWDTELARRTRAFSVPESSSITIKRLIHASNDFIVARKAPDGSAGTTIIAGYPWFADWGRDTMIAMPGLLFCTKRFDEARQVLSVFAQYVSEGMIPNRFDDYSNEPHYNTVDASLWFIHAAHEYARLSKDSATFEKILKPACRAIIEGYRKGTRFGIRMDPADSLITQGDKSTQLTWMDAKCGDICFTPRQGKAVEINALWYNALRLVGENDLAKKVEASFQKAFWISPFRGLSDVVDGGRKDNSIRPNQIFAASLPHSPLTRQQQHAVVEVVRRELLTPVGLRTLSSSDPSFHRYFTGDQFNRDKAYHNGTIWPWPIGAFLDAYLNVNDRSESAKQQARDWLKPLIEHLEKDGCIGSISEVFEAEPPHRPAGCSAQAWSVAEVLRLAIELEM